MDALGYGYDVQAVNPEMSRCECNGGGSCRCGWSAGVKDYRWLAKGPEGVKEGKAKALAAAHADAGAAMDALGV